MSSTSHDGRNSRWDEHRATRRQELIRATRKAVHHLGADASMDEIASFVGTSKSVFYRYFGDKTGLQQAVGQASIGMVEEEMRRVAQDSRTETDGLHAMISVYLQMAEEAPEVYTFATSIDAEVNLFLIRMTEYLTQRLRNFAKHTPLPPVTFKYWPAAALGFVRMAGEAWLAEEPGPDKPSANQLALHLARWLVQGLSNPGRIHQANVTHA